MMRLSILCARAPLYCFLPKSLAYYLLQPNLQVVTESLTETALPNELRGDYRYQNLDGTSELNVKSRLTTLVGDSQDVRSMIVTGSCTD